MSDNTNINVVIESDLLKEDMIVDNHSFLNEKYLSKLKPRKLSISIPQEFIEDDKLKFVLSKIKSLLKLNLKDN